MARVVSSTRTVRATVRFCVEEDGQVFHGTLTLPINELVQISEAELEAMHIARFREWQASLVPQPERPEKEVLQEEFAALEAQEAAITSRKDEIRKEAAEKKIAIEERPAEEAAASVDG